MFTAFTPTLRSWKRLMMAHLPRRRRKYTRTSHWHTHQWKVVSFDEQKPTDIFVWLPAWNEKSPTKFLTRVLKIHASSTATLWLATPDVHKISDMYMSLVCSTFFTCCSFVKLTFGEKLSSGHGYEFFHFFTVQLSEAHVKPFWEMVLKLKGSQVPGEFSVSDPVQSFQVAKFSSCWNH